MSGACPGLTGVCIQTANAWGRVLRLRCGFTSRQACKQVRYTRRAIVQCWCVKGVQTLEFEEAFYLRRVRAMQVCLFLFQRNFTRTTTHRSTAIAFNLL